jgi:hypothetical protein
MAMFMLMHRHVLCLMHRGVMLMHRDVMPMHRHVMLMHRGVMPMHRHVMLMHRGVYVMHPLHSKRRFVRSPDLVTKSETYQISCSTSNPL